DGGAFGLAAEPLGQIESSEEANRNPRSRGAEGLLSAKRLKDRFARVLLGPNPREPARTEGDLIDEARREVVARRNASASMPCVSLLAHTAGRADVCVGARDDAERIGIDAETRFHLEPFREDVAEAIGGTRLGFIAKLRASERRGRQLFEGAGSIAPVARRARAAVHHSLR